MSEEISEIYDRDDESSNEERRISPRLASPDEITAMLKIHSRSEVEVILARRYLIRQLALRSLHQKQAYALLKKLGLQENVILEAITSLQDYFDDKGWLDVRISKWMREGKSRIQVRSKLLQSGVISTEYGKESNIEFDEYTSLRELIRKKYPSLLNEEVPREKKQKIIQAILRRGFSFSSISSILRDNMLSSLTEEERIEDVH